MTSGSILLLAVIVAVPEASSAVALESTYVSPSSRVAGLSPKTVIVGGVVSTTFTVLVAVPTLPEASVAVYVNVYEPTVLVSTLPDTTTVSPVSASAPGST